MGWSFNWHDQSINQTIDQVKEKNAGAASKQETKQEAMGNSL